MSWITLSLASAIFLGLYDLAKKSAVRENAVPAVLFLNVATAALIYSVVLVANAWAPAQVRDTLLEIQSLAPEQHVLLFCKSLIVGVSWSLAFISLKHLPLSIAAPIRSTSPMWTCLIAITFFGERPGGLQAAGVILIIAAFWMFSGIGKLEGLHFHRDRWVLCMVAATILGALSALYDKYLLQVQDFEPTTVQAWFTVYLVPVTLPQAFFWFCWQRKTNPFTWKWSIPAIAVMLLIADILYFTAISDPTALISIISPLRRIAVIIPFIYGAAVLGELNWRRKAICIVIMLLGVILIGLA